VEIKRPPNERRSWRPELPTVAAPPLAWLLAAALLALLGLALLAIGLLS
jgi:hypothetical protein